MLLKITAAGIESATTRNDTGHQFDLRTFKLAYTPTVYAPDYNQTSLAGTVVYEAPIPYYKVTAEGTKEFTLLVPETAKSKSGGPTFKFNEIGIYDNRGVLVFIGILQSRAYEHVLGETRLKIRAQHQIDADPNASLDFTLLSNIDSYEWADDWVTCVPNTGTQRDVIIPDVDVTATYHAGRKVRTVIASGPITAVVESSSYDGTDTTVRLARDDIDASTTVIDYGVFSATGAGALPALGVQLYSKRIDSDYDVPMGCRGLSIEEVIIEQGATVTVHDTGRWSIIDI